MEEGDYYKFYLIVNNKSTKLRNDILFNISDMTIIYYYFYLYVLHKNTYKYIYFLFFMHKYIQITTTFFYIKMEK